MSTAPPLPLPALPSHNRKSLCEQEAKSLQRYTGNEAAARTDKAQIPRVRALQMRTVGQALTMLIC